MGLRINIPLPGPFTYSMRATPRMPKMSPQRRPASRSSCSCSHSHPAARPAQRPYIPRGETLTASEAARLRARRSPEQESAVGAWVFVWVTLIALAWLLVSCG